MEPIKKVDESDDKYVERHSSWRQNCEDQYNIAEIIIAKQRHGPIGIIKTHFDSNFTKFSDLTTKEYDNIVEKAWNFLFARAQKWSRNDSYERK